MVPGPLQDQGAGWLVYHAFPLVAGDQEQEEEKEEAPQRSSRRGFVA